MALEAGEDLYTIREEIEDLVDHVAGRNPRRLNNERPDGSLCMYPRTTK